jgi:hypothetical protein
MGPLAAGGKIGLAINAKFLYDIVMKKRKRFKRTAVFVFVAWDFSYRSKACV